MQWLRLGLVLTVAEDGAVPVESCLAWFSGSAGRSIISEAGRSGSAEITNLLELLIN